MKKYSITLSSFFRKDFGFFRTKQTFEQIKNCLYMKKIIDIGCGTGHLSKILQENEYNVTAIDVKNRIKFRDMNFILYDGLSIPSPDSTYDTALLMTVLHHTKNPDQVIQEALRVATRLIIIEDIYSTKFEKYKTFILDSIFNFEFFGHPHNNKDDNGWKKYFKEKNLNLLYTDYWLTETPIGDIKQGLYCIEKANI